MKRYLKTLVFFLAFGWSTVCQVSAQCAMCKSSIESNLSEAASTRAGGLNTGILYMMTIPYILFAVVAYFWYKHSRKDTDKKNKIEAVLKRSLGKA